MIFCMGLDHVVPLYVNGLEPRYLHNGGNDAQDVNPGEVKVLLSTEYRSYAGATDCCTDIC